MAARFSFQFPWPDPALSPNARKHFQEKARHLKAARTEAFYLALERRQEWLYVMPPGIELETRLVFSPPDRKKRDIDNLLSSMKGFLDGIFDALDANDSQVRRTILEWGEVVPKGEVLVEIKAKQS